MLGNIVNHGVLLSHIEHLPRLI